MSAPQQRALVDEQIVDSLDLSPFRLSKLTLFWYLKSLPEMGMGTILTLIPIVIGSLFSIILLIDWGIHQVLSKSKIEEVLNYDLDSIDGEKIQRWLEDPALWNWVGGLATWVFVVPMAIVAGLLLGWLILRILQWRRIHFGIEDGVIWMSGGLFTNWTRRLPITHVQSYELSSTLLQRLLTLRGVSISSAAPEGKKASIELLAVRRGNAAEITSVMQTAFGAEIASPDSDTKGATPIASVGWWPLIVAAANSFEVRLSVFSLYFIYQLLGQGPMKQYRDQVIDGVTRYAENHHGLANIVLIILGALIFFWIFSILIYIATFARFRLLRNGQLAFVEHGLFTRRWRTVLMPHIQALTFVESPAQQLVNDGSLRMTLPGTTRKSLERSMLLPAVDRTVAIDVLDRLFAELAPNTGETLRNLENALKPLPSSAKRSYMLRWVYRLIPISLILVLIMYAVPGGVSPLWGFLPLVVLGPIGILLGSRRFKDAGWVLDDSGNFVVRARALSRTTRMTRRNRIVWTRISVMRIFSGRNVSFLASVAGAGTRPGIKARLLGYGLVARADGRFLIMGILDQDAHDLADRLTKR